MADFVLKGDVCQSKDKTSFECIKDGYIVCTDGKSQGVFTHLPQKYSNLQVIDMSGKLIVPGLVDLHVHAPQYSFRGLGMDMELLDWLNSHAFPEESKFDNLEYADKAYGIFVEDLKKVATTRACIYATIHSDATLLLMDKLEESGLKTYVGKVNMDRNSPNSLIEESPEVSEADTRLWIEKSLGRYKNTMPIITPRFIPSCTDKLMELLSQLQKDTSMAFQSHLSENLGEIKWVAELCPNSKFYGDAYYGFDLFGGNVPTIMAHCVYSPKEEIELMKKQGVFIAHCPQSNTNLASGIAPVRTYLDENMKVGLGSDIAGGSSLSIFKAIVDAVQVSKLRWRLLDQSLKPITSAEAFYMATKGGGEFFGNVGGFDQGYEFDAVVIDDGMLPYPQELTLEERLERVIYLSDEGHITSKFVSGKRLF